MSTVKSKNLQVGTDATASNNFTIYQPSTPDGTLRIGVGNADSPTEVMRLDGDGNVTATNKVRVFAKKPNGTTQTASTAIPVYEETNYNVGNAYSTSTGIFTAPVAGTYSFSWAYLLQNVADTAEIDGGFLYNGIYYFGGTRYTGGERGYGGYVSEKFSVNVYLDENDTFAPRAAVSGDTSWNFYSNSTWGYFTAVLIG